jgi:hypothetical protein
VKIETYKQPDQMSLLFAPSSTAPRVHMVSNGMSFSPSQRLIVVSGQRMEERCPIRFDGRGVRANEKENIEASACKSHDSVNMETEHADMYLYWDSISRINKNLFGNVLMFSESIKSHSPKCVEDIVT